MTIREATVADKFRLVEMACRFVISTRYREWLETTPERLGALVDKVLEHGVIFVAEPNPMQVALQQRLLVMTEQERAAAVMAMSSSEKAVLNWGDAYGPNKPTIIGMLAVVVVTHPLTGKPYAEEVAWWVEPEHRHGSVGPRLMHKMEGWCVQNRLHMVKMVAPAGSSVGVFYEKCGYHPVEAAWVKVL